MYNYSHWGTYGYVVLLHSYLRWILIAASLLVVARAWIARGQGRAWSPADTTFARVFVSAFDLQLLVGGALYGWFSAIIGAALSNLPMAMQSRGLRFWVLEHPFAMVMALVLAHVGLARAKRIGGTEAQRIASLFFTLAFLILLAAIPWPLFSYGRRLFPVP